MRPDLVLERLRRCGIVVHHVARMPSTAAGRESMVVFLEEHLAQRDLARRCALQIDGVDEVTFSGHSGGIMYVSSHADGPAPDAVGASQTSWGTTSGPAPLAVGEPQNPWGTTSGPAPLAGLGAAAPPARGRRHRHAWVIQGWPDPSSPDGPLSGAGWPGGPGGVRP